MAKNIKIDVLAVKGMMAGKKPQEFLEEKGLELIAIAKQIYLSQRQLPEHNEYFFSFEVKHQDGRVFVVNTDDTWFWVEFGAHAGGKTEILGYAPMRRALDVLASGK